jgi:hypothetical protein
MLFIDNKYTKWYFKIIDSAKQFPRTGYVEKHHIIPKCMNGGNNLENLVNLSAREHFVCHLLLTKMVNKEPYLSKLKYAVILLYSTRNVKISSRLYENIRSNIKQTPEWIKKRTIHFKGRISPTKGMIAWNRGIPMSNDAKEKAAEKLKGRTPWNKNKVIPEEYRESIKEGMKKANISYSHMRSKVSCTHCGFESTQSAITRYHNNNCKIA